MPPGGQQQLNNKTTPTKTMIRSIVNVDGDEEDDELGRKEGVRGEEKLRAFQDGISLLEALLLPTPNSQANVKSRLNTLEEGIQVQSSVNNMVLDSFNNLNSDAEEKNRQLTKELRDITEGFHRQFADLKKEYNHRFELQLAENKRLGMCSTFNNQ